MNELLTKYNWKQISSAIANKQDDMWVKDKYVFVHGEGCRTFYIETTINNKLLSVDDPKRKTETYWLSELKEILIQIDIEIRSRINEIRNDKLNKLGI